MISLRHMRSLFLVPGFLAGIVPATAEPLTEAYLKTLPADSAITGLVLMRERPDIEMLRKSVRFLPRDERSAVVWKQLDDLARRTQSEYLTELQSKRRNGDVIRVKSLRLENGIVAVAKPGVFQALEGRPGILAMTQIIPRSGEIDQDSKTNTVVTSDSIPWHILQVQAPACWAEGYTGQQVLVAIIDTGINYNHTDLRDHTWDGGSEFPRHGYDFADDDDDPIDESGHGAGVAGLVAGDGSSGIHTGAAPDAIIMGLRVRQDLFSGVVTDTWLALDFALEHGADVISMSLGWGTPGPEDRPIWRSNYEILEAAGIICVKSAGNRRGERQPPSAISVPGDVPSPWRNPAEIESGTRGGLITVGALDELNQPSAVSSPGPVTWQGIAPWDDYPYGPGKYGLIKPDLAAPGENGTTLPYQFNATYAPFNGTSMAQPHVAGTVALMLSKNFGLLPVQVDSILQTTALDLGAAGKDNDFGAGLVQAKAALDATPKPAPGPGQFPDSPVPDGIALDVIYPNPFNPFTTVRVLLTDPGFLEVRVFNTLGQQVDTLASRELPPDVYEFRFDATGLASGTYIVRAELTGRRSVTRKAVFTK